MLTPFHDRKVIDIAIKIADYIQPDIVVYIGDAFDVTEWSKFPFPPTQEQTLLPALIEFNWWDNKIKEVAPNARRVFVPGNHEIVFQKKLLTTMLQHMD